MKTPSDVRSDLAALLGSLGLPENVEREITYSQVQSRSAAWADKKPSLNETAFTEHVGLRLLEGGRQGTVGTRSLAPARLAALASEALAIARATPADPHRRMRRGAASYPASIATDSSLFSRPLIEINALFSDIEKKVLQIDKRIRKVVKFHLTERKSMRALINSHTPVLVDESTSVGFAAEVLAEEGAQVEVAWDYQGRRFSKDLSIEEMALSVARHAAASLGGKPLASGKYAVVVHPRVGAQLLDLVSQALSAEAVQRGRSFLRGLLDKPVASQVVSIIDDPLLPNGIASGTFDGEGTPHRRLAVVEQGVLKDYFYDLRSAAVDKRESNGHSNGDSTNFFMAPGATPVVGMLSSASKVFLLMDVMGLHMADPITGEFSLGAAGSLYENGKYSRPVRGVTIASTVAAMLKEVSAVGPDLAWLGSTGAPSFLLPSVTIAGN